MSIEIFKIIVLSIVQGIAEWLPISSSGHLVLFGSWLEFEGASLSFDIFLHLASLVVILLYFRKEIIEVFKAPFEKEHPRKNWWWYIGLSSIFTALFGFIFYQNIETYRSVDSVSNWLLVTSILLLATKFSRLKRGISWPQAIALGVAQGFAVLPGLSRSGAVIAIAMLMKINKKDAFDYGFLVVIPAIVGSFILTVKDFAFLPIYMLGFIITVVIGYLSLVLLKKIMAQDKFYLFFIYTLILALIIKIL